MSVFRKFLNGAKGKVVFPSEKAAHDFDMGLHLQSGLPLNMWMSILSNTYPKEEANGIYYPSCG